MKYDLVKSPDYEMDGTWYVLVDDARVGSVCPWYVGTRSKRWAAFTASQVRLVGALRADRNATFRTRVDAAAEVLAHHFHRRLMERGKVRR